MDIDSAKTSSANPVAVLLHGKNFSSFYWERIANDLAAKGYRVVMIDQIGFGKSSKPKNYNYSFPQLAINTKALLDSLSISKFHVVGHSMGGMLASTIAYMYPENVSALTLINPIGLEVYLDYAKYKDPDFFYKLELNKTPAKLIAYQKKLYYDGNWKPEYNQLVEPLIGLMQGPDWPLIAWNNALTYGPIFSENIMARLSKLELPVNIILGTRDRTGPGRNWKRQNTSYKLGQYHLLAKQLKTKFSKFKIIELTNLGHMPQFEDYDRFQKKFYPLF